MSTSTPGGRPSLKSSLEPLSLGSLNPVSTRRTSPNDRLMSGGTPLTALLNGAGADAGLSSPSLWLRTPPAHVYEHPSSSSFPAEGSSELARIDANRSSDSLIKSVVGITPRSDSQRNDVHPPVKQQQRTTEGKQEESNLGQHKQSGLRKQQSEQQSLRTQQKQQQDHLVKQQGNSLKPNVNHSRNNSKQEGPLQKKQLPPPIPQQTKNFGPHPLGTRAQQLVSQHLQNQSQGQMLHQMLTTGSGLRTQPSAQQLQMHYALSHARPVVPNRGAAPYMVQAPLISPAYEYPKGPTAKKILPMDKAHNPALMNGAMNGAGSGKSDQTSTQIMRAIRNREAASKSRQAAKLKLKRLEDDNAMLRKRNAVLEKENKTLREKLVLPPLSDSLAEGSTGTAQDDKKDEIPPRKRSKTE